MYRCLVVGLFNVQTIGIFRKLVPCLKAYRLQGSLETSCTPFKALAERINVNERRQFYAMRISYGRWMDGWREGCCRSIPHIVHVHEQSRLGRVSSSQVCLCDLRWQETCCASLEGPLVSILLNVLFCRRLRAVSRCLLPGDSEEKHSVTCMLYMYVCTYE